MLTGLARIATTMLNHAADLGVDRDAVARASGLDGFDLSDPEARIPATLMERLWRCLLAQAPRPDLGLHLGDVITTREWGIVGYTMAYSQTLGDALHRLSRYSQILNQGLRCTLTSSGLRTAVQVESSLAFDHLLHPVDLRLSAILSAAREITATPVTPLEVRFPYPAPPDTACHARYFGCPLRYGCGETALIFSGEDLKRPTSNADEELCTYLDRLADEIIDSLDRDISFANKVRHVIWTELSAGNPTLGHAAATLGTSARALQRRLREEGTTFAAVLQDLRREIALGLVHNRDLAVSEIAYLLGYSEPSTFQRAFRRWTGSSPSRYRRHLA